MVHARGGFAIAGQVHHFGIGQHYRVDRRPGIREHRRCGGIVSGDGCAIAVCVRGRFVVDSVFGRCRRNHQHDEAAAADPSGDAAGLSVGCDRSICYRVLRCANVDEM